MSTEPGKEEVSGLWPLTDDGVATLRRIIDQLTEVGEAIGDFTDKEQIRQTGVTLYLKFDKKVDVMTTGQRFVVQLLQSPAMLADACRRLIAAHDARPQDQPYLGLATTRELLAEIRARGETEDRYEEEGNAMAIGAANLADMLPGSMLDYRTVGGEDA